MTEIPEGMERYDPENNNIQHMVVHAAGTCRYPDRCVVHNKSQHHMRSWPQWWREDRGMFERLCPHGIGHPDPDQVYYWRMTLVGRYANAEEVHGCDMCCVNPRPANNWYEGGQE
jgi:hypothetical protein